MTASALRLDNARKFQKRLRPSAEGANGSSGLASRRSRSSDFHPFSHVGLLMRFLGFGHVFGVWRWSSLIKSIAEDPRVKQLGPGLITGAADDDPSGIATYSQAGAQFGYSMLWTVLFTYPLMVGIQMVSARLGCITGRGLAANVKAAFPAPRAVRHRRPAAGRQHHQHRRRHRRHGRGAASAARRLGAPLFRGVRRRCAWYCRYSCAT